MFRTAQFQLQRAGDCQFVEVAIDNAGANYEAVFNYDEGTDVFAEQEIPATAAVNQGLRILRSRSEASALKLTLEGLGGHTYELRVRTPNRLSETSGVKVTEANEREAKLQVSFTGTGDTYVRQEFALPMQSRKEPKR